VPEKQDYRKPGTAGVGTSAWFLLANLKGFVAQNRFPSGMAEIKMPVYIDCLLLVA
jgi:hypothetical protein